MKKEGKGEGTGEGAGKGKGATHLKIPSGPFF